MSDGMNASPDAALGTVKVLPEAAQLEMVRAAAMLAAEDTAQVVRVANVTWHEPVIVGKGEQVHVDLYPSDNGESDWTVYADHGTDDAGTVSTVTTGSTGTVSVAAT